MMDVEPSTASGDAASSSSSSSAEGDFADVEMSEEMKAILKGERTAAAQLQLEREKRGATTTTRMESINEMASLTERRFYHELTQMFSLYLADGADFPAMDKAAFFQFVVAPLQQRLNPLRFGRLLSLIADELPSGDALLFLNHHEEALKKDDEAHIHFLTSRAYQLTRLERFKQCAELLEDVKAKINERLGLPPAVNASYHRSCATLQKAQRKHSEFYKHAVLFLAYTPLDDVPEGEKGGLAFEIVVAAIVATGIFNFNELHEHPLISGSLENSNQGWLYELLHAFAEGKLSIFDDVLARYQKEIAESELRNYEVEMRQKMKLLALMELCFRRPKKQRLLRFEEIATHCRIGLKEVELLVMKAMSNGLMAGSMDEVGQTLRVTWVQPRILDTGRIRIMKQRVDSWADAASKLLLHLEELTPELLVS